MPKLQYYISDSRKNINKTWVKWLGQLSEGIKILQFSIDVFLPQPLELHWKYLTKFLLPFFVHYSASSVKINLSFLNNFFCSSKSSHFLLKFMFPVTRDTFLSLIFFILIEKVACLFFTLQNLLKVLQRITSQ